LRSEPSVDSLTELRGIDQLAGGSLAGDETCRPEDGGREIPEASAVPDERLRVG
jgi:hypothetical protein